MTSYALSLTVFVVDPQRLDLMCRKNGGKQAESPGVRNGNVYVVTVHLLSIRTLPERRGQGTALLARCFSSVNIFQHADFNLNRTARHFTLPFDSFPGKKLEMD